MILNTSFGNTMIFCIISFTFLSRLLSPFSSSSFQQVSRYLFCFNFCCFAEYVWKTRRETQRILDRVVRTLRSRKMRECERIPDVARNYI